MNQNNSPWLHQLKINRPIDTLHEDVKTDVVIVGAGISGAMTAYYTLKFTDKQVLLLEGNRVAHGATGHNAGQVVAMFEREFHDIVREHGLEKAADAEKAIRSAWLLLEEIFEEANLTTPMSTFIGYAGYAGVEYLIEELKNNALRREAGIQVFPTYIAEKAKGMEKIPAEFRDLYEIVPHENILSLLETSDRQYIAATSQRKGCVNSALLVEEVVGYLLNTYKGRFVLAERTSVEKVSLQKNGAVLHTKTNIKNGGFEKEYTVTANRVVLCTNGFERLNIENNIGVDVDTSFHQLVHGLVGYMAAYLEDMNRQPNGLSYYDEAYINSNHGNDAYTEPPYFYVTRRPYEIEKDQHHNLVCIGGPEVLIGDTRHYLRESQFDKAMGEKIDAFVKRTYKELPGDHLKYSFEWHGLQCYTPGGIRVIGPEPKNPVLMYNLGCNGVGILPSIYGGMKIGKMLAGEVFPASIFDPASADPQSK